MSESRKFRFSRRNFLRLAASGAGAALLAPLTSRLVMGATAPSLRFVFVVEGNGVEPVALLSPMAQQAIETATGKDLQGKRWWYRDYVHSTVLDQTTADLDAGKSLAALGHHGLVDKAAVVYGLSSKIVNGGHSGRHGALSSSRTQRDVPGGQTIDAYLASLSAVRQSTPFDVVRLGVTPSVPNQPLRAVDLGTCAFGPRQPAPMVMSPTAAYDLLFGSVQAGKQATFRRRANILDFLIEDIKAAQGEFTGGSDERAKLDQYLQTVETASAQQQQLLTMEADLRASLASGRVDAALANAASVGGPLANLEAQFELATAALVGELTHVVVLGAGSGGRFDLKYSSLGDALGRHETHHRSAHDPALQDLIHGVSRRIVELIANMASVLESTPDPAGGSMLDHTVIVYLGDNGEQHHSTSSEFPVLLLGGSAMGCKTGGRTIAFPGIGGSGHRQLSNLWNSLGHLAGSDLNRFGHEGASRVAEGPLSEVMS